MWFWQLTVKNLAAKVSVRRVGWRNTGIKEAEAFLLPSVHPSIRRAAVGGPGNNYDLPAGLAMVDLAEGPLSYRRSGPDNIESGPTMWSRHRGSVWS